MPDEPQENANWEEYRRHDARLVELREAEWQGVRLELITREADGPCEASMRVRRHMISLLCAGGRAGFVNRFGDGPSRRVAQDPGWIRIVPACQPVWSHWEKGRRTYLLVLIAPETLARLCAREVPLQGQMDLRDERMRRVLEDIGRELAAPDPLGSVVGEGLIRQLAGLLARSALAGTAQLASQRGGLAPRRLRAVLELIDRQAAEKLTVDELAAEVSLSTHHFCHAFRQSTGLPPHRYLLTRRLAQARALLENPALSLADVAARAGFGGSSQFATAFRRATGLSPSAWRRRF